MASHLILQKSRGTAVDGRFPPEAIVLLASIFGFGPVFGLFLLLNSDLSHNTGTTITSRQLWLVYAAQISAFLLRQVSGHHAVFVLVAYYALLLLLAFSPTEDRGDRGDLKARTKRTGFR